MHHHPLNIPFLHRYNNLRDINSYQEGGQHGYFRTVQGSAPYVSTFTRAVIMLCRLGEKADDLVRHQQDEEATTNQEHEGLGPRNLRGEGEFIPREWSTPTLSVEFKQLAKAVSDDATIPKLHQFLLCLFEKFKQIPVRGDHPIGWVVQLMCKAENGKIASITTINHILVHLIHVVRLTTYRNLVLLRPNESDRREILSMVKKKYSLQSNQIKSNQIESNQIKSNQTIQIIQNNNENPATILPSPFWLICAIWQRNMQRMRIPRAE